MARNVLPTPGSPVSTRPGCWFSSRRRICSSSADRPVIGHAASIKPGYTTHWRSSIMISWAEDGSGRSADRLANLVAFLDEPHPLHDVAGAAIEGPVDHGTVQNRERR